jgi:diguanylate cyclase (GGDEF)-like protein
MLDLDQLRLINNRHGHLAGDELIRSVAGIVSEVAEASEGLAARFGGDELCMLLPGSSLESAHRIAERVRAQIEDVQLSFNGNGQPLTVTASAGIATYPDHADSVEGLLKAADAAVYDAKLGGRNRTRLALPASAREALYAESRSAEDRRELDGDRRESGDRRQFADEPQLLNRDVPGTNGHQPPLNGGHGSANGDRAEADYAPKKPGAVARPRLLRLYIGLLCAAAVVVALLSSPAAILDSAWLFVALVAGVVVLDAVRIDVFERANLSPAAVPELALAFFFGPLGPIAAEAVIALSRLIRRDPLLKWSFDFGALSLAGTAAAATFALFPDAPDGALLAIATLAGIAHYVVNSALLAIVMSLAEGRGPLTVWRERLAWMAPHYLAFGLLAGTFVISEHVLGMYVFAVFGLPMVMLWIAEKQYLDRSRATVTELRTSNDELEAANAQLRTLLADNEQLLGRMHRSYLSTITSLARTIEAKDPYTGGHTERVARLAVLLATELGFDSSELPAIDMGATIHDIGKIGIPDEILLKPGPLDAEEVRTMRTHPELSSYIVADLELPAVVKQMVRSHHERWDGGGYPDGLAGEEIPLAARILSVADALDAMTSDRPYRKALPIDVARAEIEAQAGTQFCPQVVVALGKLMESSAELWAAFGGEIGAPAEAESADASLS